MEYGTAEYNLRLREVQALEKIAESLNIISMSQASMALSPSNTVPLSYSIPDPNMHNILNAFPRNIHITVEGSDEDGTETREDSNSN